jgi:very-short-patch-repair endonuclease
MAAVLACGEGAVVSHECAASIYGVLNPRPGPVDITLPGRSNRSRSGIRLHRTRSLERVDVRYRFRISLTAPARTLIDLARVLSAAELQRACEEAQVRRLVTLAELRSALDRSPGRRGTAAMRALLEHDSPPALTRSEAEARLLALLRAADLTPTATNTRVGRHEVDFVWRRQRLVVEVDGFAYHASREAFERDRLRDAELRANGYRVIRVTWRQIEDRPEAVIARLAQALAVARA